MSKEELIDRLRQIDDEEPFIMAVKLLLDYIDDEDITEEFLEVGR